MSYATAATLEETEPPLRSAIRLIARVPQLLVACDYDGTLAPIVEDPARAVPLPEAIAAVRSLAALPQTTVAVVSGRALRDLATLSRLPSEVYLVGSHGSEFDIGFVEQLAPELVELHDRLRHELTAITKGRPGVRLEIKPASIAVHTRGADRALAAQVVQAVRSGPATWPDVHVTTGSEVLELAVIATHKGVAVDTLRTQLSASAVLYLGDDVTDENAFAHLHGPDVGVKVGTGPTRAAYRVQSPVAAARVLAFLVEARRRWLYGERTVPIERHSMLANGHTVALLTPAAKVTWMCNPRPDSSAIFADLLGGPPAGYFTVRPARPLTETSARPLGQRYVPGTMTVETRWSGMTVTDWLDLYTPDENGSPVPEGDETSQATALVRVISGHVRVRIEFAPRPEFGQMPIGLQPLGDSLHVLGSNEAISLHAPGVEWDINREGPHDTASAEIDLNTAGGLVTFELRLGGEPANAPPVPGGPVEPEVPDGLAQRWRVRQRLAEEPWRDWVSKLKLPVVARDLVGRSALTLRALCHAPTGAILAAGTMSLPEELGGVRNWDYRYCWLRDAALSARALVDLGSTEEAEALLGWTASVIERTAGHPERLHPLYTVEGLDLGPEAVIETLPGYAGSRPVRVGNAANRQVQLDVFGPIADLISALADHRGLTPLDISLTADMLSAVERRWHEPDHGLWEARLAPRHHVYSKVMCWYTVDRAVQICQRHGLKIQPEWAALREAIAANVMTHGWHDGVGAFTVAYGFPELDAASLWVGLSNMLADDDPRFLATVLAIEAQLREGPTVYRYRWDDGLPGREGGFTLCTAWLVEAYLRTGRRTEAEELFAQLLDCAGPTGLLPEQYDPVAERGLGNHPQAYSHLGLIRCALLLDGAVEG